MSLTNLFQTAKETPSDINEHLETLYKYGKLCKTITEFGCRWGNSTTAFLCAQPKKLISYDIEIYNQINMLKDMASVETPGTEFIIRNENTLFADIDETDLLFIDSYHVYEQVLLELIYHADKAKKFLIFHDVITYGEKGQTNGYRGIKSAIDGFLTYHPEWAVIDFYENNNGLLVCARNQRRHRFWK